ncbi:manganese efflux pump [Clostridium sporogenes]|uniref:manganese efflux pump MntP n=1 Tax=Clostridium sporogenes TaxID=1509 RepID=UPI0013C70FCF|nr:manganese efflux pump MntP family protein [Clostridium sporogenes]NFQ02296.1 manganese efflux pump [Clostridium sporogenes]NFQ43469.1 manganese efflux pump [Clostridium sporogenes]NFT05086.1 manganese efflux pump [Clostridium sporogenes]NFT33619.1 manganese efflux pump [Clostridium sporogenes]NFT40702.1 manganese efflux pump [Clostridium sporogenes]
MDFVSIILISIGLSMDAFAVSITNGAIISKVTASEGIRIGLFFGGFQALMPLIGWSVGIKFQSYISTLDHWIALILLSIIGGKMVYDSIKESKDHKDEIACDYATGEKKCLNNKTLTILAIATSIDALAVGVSFAFLKVSIISTISIIGTITFVICFIGVMIGKKCGELLKKRAEILGGIVLIFIGIKIFIEHTNILSNIF